MCKRPENLWGKRDTNWGLVEQKRDSMQNRKPGEALAVIEEVELSENRECDESLG